jgi:DNA-binding IclR family transcriptional regulator
MREAKTGSVRAVERAFLLLETLGRSEHGLTLSQLTRKLALPRSSLYCLLLTLERCGYLHHERPSGRYTFSLKLFSLANSALHAIALRKHAAPVLRDLTQKTLLTVHLGILEHHEVVLMDKVEPPGPVRVATWAGKRMGVHCTALGKALLA